MHRIFQSFVDTLADGVDVKSLHATLADVAKAFDFPMFAYFSVPIGLRGTTWLISNYSSAWTERYLRNRYDRLDPVIVSAASSIEPFVWGNGVLSSEWSAEQSGFFEEAAMFGIRNGFTVPIREQRIKVAAVTFAVDESPPAFNRSVERHGRILQLMAMYFHKQAKQLLSSDRVVDGVSLTKRELECLSWAARGKSAWDIGQILGISKRTATFHLDNARAKLNVHSIPQAVALLAASRRPH